MGENMARRSSTFFSSKGHVLISKSFWVNRKILNVKRFFRNVELMGRVGRGSTVPFEHDVRGARRKVRGYACFKRVCSFFFILLNNYRVVDV